MIIFLFEIILFENIRPLKLYFIYSKKKIRMNVKL